MTNKTCLIIFFVYTAMSLLMAVPALSTDSVNVAFDYNHYFSIDSFLPYIALVFVFVFPLILALILS